MILTFIYLHEKAKVNYDWLVLIHFKFLQIYFTIHQLILNQFQNLNSIACYTFAGGSSAFALHLDVHCLIYLGAIITIFLLGDFSKY